MKEFPQLLAIVVRRDKSQWEIGDQLIKDCGPVGEWPYRDGSRSKVEQAANYLLGNGHDYSVITLAQYREIASDFPSNRRHKHLAWSTHLAAGSADVLDAIVAGSKGKRFGPEYVRAVRAAQRRAEEQERAAEREKAQREAEKAAREVERAKEQLKSSSVDEKPAARVKVERAKEHLLAAKHAARTPPKQLTGKVKPSDMGGLVAEVSVWAEMGKAAHAVTKIEKALTIEVIAAARPTAIAAMREDAIGAMNTWKRIVDRLAKVSPPKQQRGHLYAVGE
jgi:hypothetical protein